jgi:hypothetical protein
MNVKTLLRSLVGLVIGGALGIAIALPAQAGYGNHAERATENIQTRAGLAKLTLVNHVSQFKVVEARGGLPQPQP